MNRTRNILRILFLVLAVILLVYVNKKSNDDTMSVMEFKFKMHQKIGTDSLATKDKLDLLVNETSKFVDNSSRVRKGVHYLMGLFGLLIVAELVFLMLNKNNHGRVE